MIVAVFCVAAAMIAGGTWAVFTGWELIIIERGWTQVLLGGMLITGGLLLGGIGVLATHVKRLASKLGEQPGRAHTPSLSADFGPATRNGAGAAESSRSRTEAPIMPSPPPRPEPRVEPVAEPTFEQADKPAGPTISAPAAIALGAAAGAGTAAIASVLLSSGAQRPSEGEGAERDAEAEVAQADEELAGKGASILPFAATNKEERAVAVDGEIPTPDGEDAEMASAQEDLEAETLEAEALKAGVSPGLEPEETGRMMPPVEEPAAAPVESTATTAEPEVGPEKHYSAAVDETHEAAVEATTEREGTTVDRPGPPAGEDIRKTQPRPADLYRTPFEEHSGEPLEEPFEEPLGMSPEEPVEQPERSLVGTYESGGNIYTMYSDGSIDAQTPAGNFHFASLEELKHFIAEGGEDPAA
jgi:hypothetical protein